MSKQSVVVLGDTQVELNTTGDKTRADGYFGFKDGLHTVTFHLADFTGRISIEATLESDPQESDWFPIFLDGSIAYIEYPLIPLDPTGINGDTHVDAFTFQVNALYIRAKMDRSYVTPVPITDAEISLLGVYQKNIIESLKSFKIKSLISNK